MCRWCRTWSWIRAKARASGQDLRSYLDSLPLERTIEIHVHDPVADRELFWPILDHAPVRAITIGWDARHKDADQALTETVRELKERIGANSDRRIYPVAQPAAKVDQHFCLASGVAVTLRDGSVKVTGGAAAFQLEVAPESLPVFTYFATPNTLASALLALSGPCLDDHDAMPRVAAVMRELMEAGVLVPAEHVKAINAEVWNDWDAALDFYLATRTRKQTAFASLVEIDEALAEKAEKRPQPSAYKDYHAHPFFPLPNPLIEEPVPVGESGFLDVLLRRRSLRAFTDEPVSATDLSALLFYVWGATGAQRNQLGDVFLRKTSPGGGSLHGAEVYPILLNVDGYDPGLYHYSVRRHGLVLLSREHPSSWVAGACGDQRWIADAAVLFLSTYNVKRLAWKYAYSRGFRAALLDTGHLGQSFALVATYLGLAPFTTAALRDELFEEKLGLEYLAESVLMANGVGRPANALLLPDRPRDQVREMKM